MRRIAQVTLGILTAVGGFVDIGDLVANAETGARFGLSLAWVVVLGVVGIVVYAEMAGRVAAVAGRATFDVVRERLGARAALLNLGASAFITFLTLAAEIAGVAMAIRLATSVNDLLWVPLVAFAVWVVIWRVGFESLERVFSVLGLALVAFTVALVHLSPDWGHLFHLASRPSVPGGEGHPTWFYFAIALLGSAMTPYEVFFFSSGAVEEKWSLDDLALNRANVFVGFPLGGLLSLSIMATSALVLMPRGISVDNFSQVPLPVVASLGKAGLAFVLVGMFAATFGAALETGLSTGYTVAQFFGWQWGKYVRPREAARFHVAMLGAIGLAALVMMSGVDPIKVTEYSIVLSAAALPLTYFPILVISNDPQYMGEHTNGRLINAIGVVYLAILVAAALATIPLMIATKAGA